MATFYGTVSGSASTIATRRGSTDITVSAQSWHGSVIVRLYYRGKDLMVDLQTAEGSSASGYTAFWGTFEEFKEKLKKMEDDADV